MSKTDWHLLESFRVAGRLQHVTRAAEQLGTSQPALSRALARLQSDLGVQLFRRAGRSIRLTTSGERVPGAGGARARRDRQGRRELADLKEADRGLISLGFLRTLGAKYIPELVRRFSIRHPAVRFTFVQNNSAAIEAQLERGDAGPYFCGGAARPTGGFEWIRVADQEFVLIVPHTHRLARRRQVRLHEVADEPFVSVQAGARDPPDDRRVSARRRASRRPSASRATTPAACPDLSPPASGSPSCRRKPRNMPMS